MHDFRDAYRALRSTPIVTAVAILSLALGIGANSAMFSILDALLLRSLPVAEPGELAMLGRADRPSWTSWTNPIWEAVRQRSDLFDGAFAWSSTRFNLAPGGQTDLVDGIWASGRFFDTLGVRAILGRTFTEADDRRGGGPDGPVAVISHALWQRRFDGAADVVGRTITIERVPFTIIGVTPPDFFGVDVGRTFDVAIPIGTDTLIRGKESALDRRSWWWLGIMVRTKPGQSVTAASAALRGVQPQIREETTPHDWRPQDQASYLKEAFTLVRATTGRSGLRDRYQRPLTTLMVIVGLVLLIACANIANLLLARATARRHELSIRVALGASRWRIARQLLAESLLLSAVGALAGLGIALLGSRLLVRQLSTTTNTVFLDLALDWRILAFTAAVGIGTALLFGTAPALRGTRVSPHDALKSQGRGLAGGGRHGLGHALVVLQVALSLVLVVGAGLFVRTFTSLAAVDLGFRPDPVLLASVNAQRLQLEPAQRGALFGRTLDAARAVPGVASAALSVVTPVSGGVWNNRIDLPDGPDLPETERLTNINLLSSGWFDTYGTPFIAGRDFAETDTEAAPQVAIVNEAFARKFTPGRSPIGARVRQPGGPTRPAIERQIVGYVKDAVYQTIGETVPPTLYIPLRQSPEPPSTATVNVRAAVGSPAQLVRPLAAALTQVHGDVAITFRPLADQVAASIVQQRLVAWLSGFFGGLALLLAGLGLYGVTAYAVSRRRAEMGVRLALGAAASAVVWLILRRVALLVGLGAALGLGVTLWASTFVAPLLFRLEPRDPATLAASVAVLAAIGGLAGWIPARRASRIDPAAVLREG